MGYDERDIARNKTPEHQWERYYNLKPGDVYVEAGAYLCRYGRIASRKVGPGGRVILIEPSPQNVEVIKEVIDEMNLGNVILVEKAVWSEKGTNLFRVDGNPGASQLVFQQIPSAEIIEVKTDTVDNILDGLGLNHVDLFAADVENAEVEMVKGMKRGLGEERIKNIAIAAYHKHPDGNYAEISMMLRKKGYRVIKVWGGVVYAHVSRTTQS